MIHFWSRSWIVNEVLRQSLSDTRYEKRYSQTDPIVQTLEQRDVGKSAGSMTHDGWSAWVAFHHTAYSAQSERGFHAIVNAR
jgi:hypothetical protein